jgi:hypothetical protein
LPSSGSPGRGATPLLGTLFPTPKGSPRIYLALDESLWGSPRWRPADMAAVGFATSPWARHVGVGLVLPFCGSPSWRWAGTSIAEFPTPSSTIRRARDAGGWVRLAVRFISLLSGSHLPCGTHHAPAEFATIVRCFVVGVAGFGTASRLMSAGVSVEISPYPSMRGGAGRGRRVVGHEHGQTVVVMMGRERL